jgi:hypothetical protein
MAQEIIKKLLKTTSYPALLFIARLLNFAQVQHVIPFALFRFQVSSEPSKNSIAI